MKKLTVIFLGLAMVGSMAIAAAAMFTKPEEAISYRKATMTLIGHHFSRMGGVVKGEAEYAPAAVGRDADLVVVFSKLPWEAFMTAGSDKGDTRMKAEALQNSEDFEAAAKAMEDETAKLAEILETGDQEAFKAQFGAAAQSCKSCHSRFRS
ncbi:MAG: c-type cytochrome [Desulfobacterales bacterium]